MKTTNKYKTKPNETKAWFRSHFTPSGQEMDHAHTALRPARGLPLSQA